MSVWFVTGSSRGIGAEIVRKALADGHKVVATARTVERVTELFPDAGNHLLALQVDVTQRGQVAAAVRTAVEAFGTIDVVVNNAGQMKMSSIEELSDDAVHSVYNTNVFGVLNVLREVLPVLRSQGSGHIMNISSSLGFSAGIPGFGLYNSSKFALEAISETMHLEVAPLGIKVTIVEPGQTRSGFDLDFGSAASTIADYDPTVGATGAYLQFTHGAEPGCPVKTASAIMAVAAAENPPLRVQLGSDSLVMVESKLAAVHSELESWRWLSVSTDYVSAPVETTPVRTPVLGTSDIELTA